MDEMILLNSAMVKHTVRKFLEKNPNFAYLQEDLVSHATVGLVKAVNQMAGIPDKDREAIPPVEMTTPNPTAFLGSYIFFYLGRLIEQESTIRIPNRTRQDRKKRGKDLFIPTKEESIDDNYVFQQEGLIDPRTLVDLVDELMGCCETQTERSMIQHRIEGRSDQDIADILGVPRATVNLMRRQIYERFKGRNDEYDTDD